MVLFDFKSEGHFVASSDRTTLKIYELANPTIHPCYIRKTHWREVADIVARDHDDNDVDEEDEVVDDGDDAAAEESSSYNGLMFFDGHGKIEGREALTKLAQHLTRLQLMVSPQGQCYQNVVELGEHGDFGIQYLRLNDLFNWPNHGVGMASVSTWQRLVLKYTLPRREGKRSMMGGVSKEKYEELKKKKDEELEKLRGEMAEQDGEIQKLKEEREDACEQQEAELRDFGKRKDEEMRKVLMRKNDELEMLRKEKDDELKILKGEMENLRNANKENEARVGKIVVDRDEWQKLKKVEADMRQEEVTKKDEERKKKLENEKRDNETSHKDVELQKLRKEKEDMMKANAAETRNLRDQLSHHRELEQRCKQPWENTSTTRFYNGFIVNVHRRRSVPRDTWCNNAAPSHCYSYVAHTTGVSLPTTNWAWVDEDPKDWPPPPKITVVSQPGQFDTNNWWFVKTFHPDGGLTMMAYYDGNQTCFTDTSNFSIRLPFQRNAKLWTTTPFFLVYVDASYRLAFMYRD